MKKPTGEMKKPTGEMKKPTGEPIGFWYLE